jgi:7-carboxy-7-deazaguanine synthase
MIEVAEIFRDIQGESSFAGYPCTFIRLAGCNLNCTYCDTDHEVRKKLTTKEIVERVEQYGCLLVEITGGEPLIQKETPSLISTLLGMNYMVLLETNGTILIRDVNRDCRIILDIKCPSSGEHTNFQKQNIKHLLPHDEVKFVIGDRGDYNWAKRVVKHIDGNQIHFSPVWGELPPAELGDWIMRDRLNVRLHLQQHKIIKILSEGKAYLAPCVMGGLETGRLVNWKGVPL